MLSLQPIFLDKYLNFSHASWQFYQPTKALFYLSWEDALWDLIKHKNIAPQSVILVPEFFCDDVEHNMRAHELIVAYYPVNSDLQTTQSQLIKAIDLHLPAIIVIFHSVGIRNQLLVNRHWVKRISDQTVLIEDCVHRIIDPAQVRFYKKNHFMLTSLRKVVPLQGSVLFGRTEDLPFKESNPASSWWYSVKVTVLWLLMNISARFSHVLYSRPQLAKQFSLLSEKLMLVGYDLIGDNAAPAKGWPLFFWLYKRFDFKNIKAQKETQAKFYEKLFLGRPLIYKPSDRKELRGWPLIIPLDGAKRFIESVRKEGILLRFELNNSVWSEKQKIVYLPMGLHVSSQQQRTVANIILKYI